MDDHRNEEGLEGQVFNVTETDRQVTENFMNAESFHLQHSPPFGRMVFSFR